MTCTIDTRSKRHLSAKLAAGLAISALLVLGTFVTSASAQDRRDDHRDIHRDAHQDNHRDDPRGGDYRGYRGNDGPDGGYYRAPPVVYGTPYYYPPPVVYGPAIGITVPGFSIGIR